MNIYLLYTTDDMKNMKTTDVRDARNKLESSLNKIPAYDLAVIDGVIWRVAVVDSDEFKDTIDKAGERIAIPPNSQGFRGTALGAKDNTISREFVYSITDDCHKKNS
jgi:hypothetical protein